MPVLDLDTVAWEPDQPTTLRPEEAARAEVQVFCQNRASWIVEGCYANLIEAALLYSPQLILLNPGEAVCLANCRARPWEPHKYASKSEQDANLQFLLSWVSDYYTRGGPLSQASHLACFRAYPGSKRELESVPDLSKSPAAFLAWLRAEPKTD